MLDFVDYKDVPVDLVPAPTVSKRKGPRGGVSIPFPIMLSRMLEEVSDSEEWSDVVSWQPHGRAFLVQQMDKFVSEVMPRYFKQSKWTSFQRQLNLYGFVRLNQQGRDRGAYWHPLFLRGMTHFLPKIHRVGKATLKQMSAPTNGFYQLPYCGAKEGEGLSTAVKATPTKSSSTSPLSPTSTVSPTKYFETGYRAGSSYSLVSHDNSHDEQEQDNSWKEWSGEDDDPLLDPLFSLLREPMIDIVPSLPLF